LKIGLLHDSKLPPKHYGGIERIVMALAKEFRKLGHEVVLLANGESTVGDFELVPLPEGFKQTGLESVIPSDLDFLHSHQPLGIKPKIPFLITIHGNGHSGESYFQNTNFLSQSHARNHQAKHYIYNGVDPDHYPFKENKEDYFVFLARTTWRVKNLKTAKAWARDLGVRLEIMGGSGVSLGKTHYNGLTDEDTKLRLLSGARALIYPTNWDEPCAAAPLEALACGTPVISTKNGCMPELVREGTGVLCADYQELLKAEEKVKEMRPIDCRDSVTSFFSLTRMAGDYLRMYTRILQDGELDHYPSYNFKNDSVNMLFKPTLANKVQYALTGKI